MQILNQVPIPFYQEVEKGIPRGAEIELNGQLISTPDQAVWFEYRALDAIALHVNIRLGFNNDYSTVINSYEHGRWGHEERHSNSLNSGGQLQLKVSNHFTGWEISVNSKSFRFPHRVSASRVTRLEIRGSLRVDTLQFHKLKDHVTLHRQQVPPYQPSFSPQPYQPTGSTDHGLGQGVAYAGGGSQGFGQGGPSTQTNAFGQPGPQDLGNQGFGQRGPTTQPGTFGQPGGFGQPQPGPQGLGNQGFGQQNFGQQTYGQSGYGQPTPNNQESGDPRGYY